jgi:hypothetical protein
VAGGLQHEKVAQSARLQAACPAACSKFVFTVHDYDIKLSHFNWTNNSARSSVRTNLLARGFGEWG